MAKVENTQDAKQDRPVPSQAEGERNPGEDTGQDRPRPSQAEGDRETVEEDLRQKSGKH